MAQVRAQYQALMPNIFAEVNTTSNVHRFDARIPRTSSFDPRSHNDVELSHIHSASQSTYTIDSSAKPIDDRTELMRHPPAQRSQTKWGKWKNFVQQLQGWKGGLTFSLTLDVVVLAICLAATVTVVAAFPRENTESILINGQCKKAKSWSTGLHLAINIASTALLSTSSYAMQCLAAPTRAEVDQSHQRRKYLTIGVSSISNLPLIGKQKRSLYLLLAMTSIPIHLLFNSAMYITQSTSSYFLFVANHDFQERLLQFNTSIETYSSPFFMSTSSQGQILKLNATSASTISDLVSRMDYLDRNACIQAYSSPFVSDRRHVIAVSNSTKPPSRNTTFIDIFYQSPDNSGSWTNYSDPSIWTCAFVNVTDTVKTGTCDLATALRKGSDFAIPARNDMIYSDADHTSVDHCLSERMDESCQLRANLIIWGVVVVCTITKSVVLFLALRNLSPEILTTIGDAIASFLASPEPLTRDCSLLDCQDMQGYSNHSNIWIPGLPLRRAWSKNIMSNRWVYNIPASTMLTLSFLQIGILLFSGTMLVKGLSKLLDLSSGDSIRQSLFRGAGFGTVNVNFIIYTPALGRASSLLASVVLVNTPQLLLSCCYFANNQAWTYMLMGQEWTALGNDARTLRVSQPAGLQRSNYFLAVPYRFGIPLQVASALLHWLMSQSFFLASIKLYSGAPFVPLSSSMLNAIGYSPFAFVFFIALFGSLAIAIWTASIIKRPHSPIPVVKGNSFAISAACHPPQEETEGWLGPLKWGVIPSMVNAGVYHCALSSKPVYSPEYLPMTTRHGHKLSRTEVEFT